MKNFFKPQINQSYNIKKKDVKKSFKGSDYQANDYNGISNSNYASNEEVSLSNQKHRSNSKIAVYDNLYNKEYSADALDYFHDQA